MKKTLILLAISFVSAALTDVTFAIRSHEFTFIITAVVYLLTAFLFYNRIREKTVLNSLLIFFFLIALISSAYYVNPRAHVIWNFVIIASLFGYIVGMASKILTGNRRIILLTLSIGLIITCGLTVVSKIAKNDNEKFQAEFKSERNSKGENNSQQHYY